MPAAVLFPRRYLRHPATVEVRGEVLMPVEAFEKLNELLLGAGKQSPSARGTPPQDSHRQKHPRMIASWALDAIIHGIGQVEGTEGNVGIRGAAAGPGSEGHLEGAGHPVELVRAAAGMRPAGRAGHSPVTAAWGRLSNGTNLVASRGGGWLACCDGPPQATLEAGCRSATCPIRRLPG